MFRSATGYHFRKRNFECIRIIGERRSYSLKRMQNSLTSIRQDNLVFARVVRKKDSTDIRPIAQVVIEGIVAYLSRDGAEERKQCRNGSLQFSFHSA